LFKSLLLLGGATGVVWLSIGGCRGSVAGVPPLEMLLHEAVVIVGNSCNIPVADDELLRRLLLLIDAVDVVEEKPLNAPVTLYPALPVPGCGELANAPPVVGVMVKVDDLFTVKSVGPAVSANTIPFSTCYQRTYAAIYE